MKHLIFIFFLLGACVEMVKGPFRGQYWKIIAVNANGRYNIVQDDYILKDVRGSYLIPTERENCK